MACKSQRTSFQPNNGGCGVVTGNNLTKEASELSSVKVQCSTDAVPELMVFDFDASFDFSLQAHGFQVLLIAIRCKDSCPEQPWIADKAVHKNEALFQPGILVQRHQRAVAVVPPQDQETLVEQSHYFEPPLVHLSRSVEYRTAKDFCPLPLTSLTVRCSLF
jgi:hypothetical protein